MRAFQTIGRAAIVSTLLGACAGPEPAAPPPALGGLPAFASAHIETGADGRCYGRGIEPAVIETRLAVAVETPAPGGPDGAVARPVYRTVERQEVVRSRREVRFETPCPPAYTATFVESLQRALAARGLYGGPISGRMDARTAQAVQRFQRDAGPDSPLLAMDTARALGLVSLSAEELSALSGG